MSLKGSILKQSVSWNVVRFLERCSDEIVDFFCMFFSNESCFFGLAGA